ncbi:hypothetical protein [Cellulomonas soli]
MNPVLALAPRLQRAGGRDARVVTGLAVTAFAVSTALTLSVVGGLLGFVHRAQHPTSQYLRDVGDAYVLFAWTALVLLVVPLVTLGGAAARLGVSRRDARLATLRLLGATPAKSSGSRSWRPWGRGSSGPSQGRFCTVRCCRCGRSCRSRGPRSPWVSCGSAGRECSGRSSARRCSPSSPVPSRCAA